MDTLTLLSFCLSPLLLALCGRAIWFCGYAAYAALHEQIEGSPAQVAPAELSEFYPKVTVVKLLQSGETTATLQSFCQQRYPHYQIIFAVAASDGAIAQVEAVEKLIQQFPEQDIQYITYPVQPNVSTQTTGLSHALKAAKFDFWVFADCCSMTPDALQHLVQPFRYPSVGAVQGLQLAQRGWLSQWQTLALAAEWYPELLVARHQNSVCWMPSSLVAVRKAAVMQLGGIETMVDELSTGIGLSDQLANIGHRVAACHLRNRCEPSQGEVPSAGSIWTMLQQRLNQVRQVRRLHPWKYALKGTLHSTIASLLLLWLWQGAAWAWFVVALTGLSRLAVTGLIGIGCLKDPTLWRSGLLLPFYDLLSFGLWCLGWFGSVPQKQASPASSNESFERIELTETEFLGLLVQPAKVKGT